VIDVLNILLQIEAKASLPKLRSHHHPIDSIDRMPKKARQNNDTPWKKILRDYFPQAIAFFFPTLNQLIDWDKGYEFLDKEFEQIPPLTSLTFDFAITKLLDYKPQETQLQQSTNPFAWITLAHLKTQSTKRNPTQRKTWKFAIMRHLYIMGMPGPEIRNLYRFIDWTMILPEDLEAEFWPRPKGTANDLHNQRRANWSGAEFQGHRPQNAEKRYGSRNDRRTHPTLPRPTPTTPNPAPPNLAQDGCR
jgi:hypothetical protein